MVDNIEPIRIGPKTCDNENIRNKEINELWERLIKSETFNSSYPIMGLSYDIFLESLACYQNDAYLGSSVMCRNSLEAAIYIMASTKEIMYGNCNEQDIIRNYGLEECRKYIGMYYGTMLSMAKEKYIIDESIEKNMKKVREEGNFAVHLAAKIDEERDKIIKDYYTKSKFQPRQWITKEKAYETLDKTVNILIELSKIVYNTNCKK